MFIFEMGGVRDDHFRKIQADIAQLLTKEKFRVTVYKDDEIVFDALKAAHARANTPLTKSRKRPSR